MQIHHHFTQGLEHFQTLVSVGGLEAIPHGYQRMTVLPYMEMEAHPIRDKSELNSTVYRNGTRHVMAALSEGVSALEVHSTAPRKHITYVRQSLSACSCPWRLSEDPHSHCGPAHPRCCREEQLAQRKAGAMKTELSSRSLNHTGLSVRVRRKGKSPTSYFYKREFSTENCWWGIKKQKTKNHLHILQVRTRVKVDKNEIICAFQCLKKNC